MRLVLALLVLLHSTPSQAFCSTYEAVAYSLVRQGYEFSKIIKKRKLLFIQRHYQRWVIIEIREDACVIAEGVWA